MISPVASLGNPFVKGDHLPLGRVDWFSAALGPFMILVSRKDFLEAFQGFKELSDTLWYCGFTELDWSFQFLGTILRMWHARSTSSKGPVIFMDSYALEE